MKSLLFVVGFCLIALAMGDVEGLGAHSGSAKSSLPYMAYWIVNMFRDCGGKYTVVIVGVVMVILSFIPSTPKKKK
jgi:hypothetical protein